MAGAEIVGQPGVYRANSLPVFDDDQAWLAESYGSPRQLTVAGDLPFELCQAGINPALRYINDRGDYGVLESLFDSQHHNEDDRQFDETFQHIRGLRAGLIATLGEEYPAYTRAERDLAVMRDALKARRRKFNGERLKKFGAFVTEHDNLCVITKELGVSEESNDIWRDNVLVARLHGLARTTPDEWDRERAVWPISPVVVGKDNQPALLKWAHHVFWQPPESETA